MFDIKSWFSGAEGKKTREYWATYYKREFTGKVLEAHYYSIAVSCSNCLHRTGLFVGKGVLVSAVKCPRCSNANLSPLATGDRVSYILPELSEVLSKEISVKVDEALALAWENGLIERGWVVE